jgi:hypothetical protein
VDSPLLFSLLAGILGNRRDRVIARDRRDRGKEAGHRKKKPSQTGGFLWKQYGYCKDDGLPEARVLVLFLRTLISTRPPRIRSTLPSPVCMGALPMPTV